MNSSEAYRLIEQIAATSSKLDKERLVSGGCFSPFFTRVLSYTYDPFVTYGIVPKDWRSSADGIDFDSQTWALLDALANRTLTGNAARAALDAEFDRLNEPSAALLWRIVRKDLRAGFSASTINKAIKGLIPSVPYMRCSLPEDVDMGRWRYFISQTKADGVFFNLSYHSETGEIELFTRQGQRMPLDHFGSLVDEARRTLKPGTQTHGEIVVFENGKRLSRKTSNGIVTSVMKGGSFASCQSPIFFAWDQVPLQSAVPKGSCSTPYEQRLKELIKQVGRNTQVRLIETSLISTIEGVNLHYRANLRSGEEGTVVKNPDGIWRDTGSSGSPDQVKFKPTIPVDLRIVGIVKGKSGKKNADRAGSLACESACGKLKVNVTVKNEKMRDCIDANPEDWIDKVLPVFFSDLMEPGPSNEHYSLFLVRMAEDSYRIDKSEADTLEEIIKQHRNAVKGD